MKLLFFDMEFADGRVPGSIYSIGYTVTDGEFEELTPATDLLINPESTWNEYVQENILAYPREVIDASPNFADLYEELKRLFSEVDLAVGFATSNDLRALNKDCERYGLEPIEFSCFDTERLCRMTEEHAEVRGLGNCVEAWCGKQPENRHRSDGDALATRLLFEAICRAKHATPEMMALAYPECVTSSCRPKKKSEKGRRRKQHAGKKRRHRRSSVSPASENTEI